MSYLIQTSLDRPLGRSSKGSEVLKIGVAMKGSEFSEILVRQVNVEWRWAFTFWARTKGEYIERGRFAKDDFKGASLIFTIEGMVAWRKCEWPGILTPGIYVSRCPEIVTGSSLPNLGICLWGLKGPNARELDVLTPWKTSFRWNTSSHIVLFTFN